MSWTFRATAMRDQWNGQIKKGESFTWIQNSSSPNAIFLKEQIEKTGRKIAGYSSLPSGPSNVGESKETNGWLLEFVHKR